MRRFPDWFSALAAATVAFKLAAIRKCEGDCDGAQKYLLRTLIEGRESGLKPESDKTLFDLLGGFCSYVQVVLTAPKNVSCVHAYLASIDSDG